MRLFIWWLLFAMLTAAQDKSVVRASADAVVQVAPDRARVDVGVVSQAQTAQAAGDENARRVQQVMTELRKLAGPKAEIRTLYYSVQPNYRTPRPGGSPEITGYTASNTVQVTLDDLSLVGKVIDGAMRSGANNIHGVQFSIRDEKPARAQALAQAAQIARTEAEAIAKALGLRVIRVHGAEEGERQPVFPMQTRMAMAEAAQTPIEPGAIDVRGSVTVTLEVQP